MHQVLAEKRSWSLCSKQHQQVRLCTRNEKQEDRRSPLAQPITAIVSTVLRLFISPSAYMKDAAYVIPPRIASHTLATQPWMQNNGEHSNHKGLQIHVVKSQGPLIIWFRQITRPSKFMISSNYKALKIYDFVKGPLTKALNASLVIFYTNTRFFSIAKRQSWQKRSHASIPSDSQREHNFRHHRLLTWRK